MNRRFGLALLAFAALLSLFAVSAWADSQARIVRLSDVQGNVQMDRGTGEGYQKAFLNMPVTQGVRLRTAEDARAEVEFEDGSTIHLTPETTLHFTELSLRDSGAKLSTVNVQQGEAYFDFTARKNDEFKVTFGHQSATLTKAAHFRVNVDDAEASLAVFKGEVPVSSPSGDVQVSKRQTASFDLASNDQHELAKNVEEDPFDAWDKKETDYHDRYTASNTSNAYSSAYSYGSSDLAYYGNYMNLPGYGTMWQPYFTGVGWDPFMDGAWMWYPGFGYSWVSAYPWGWAPYHSGQWVFVPRYGWLWQPGGSFIAWNNLPPVVNAPVHYVPPRPPVVTGPGRTMVAVGRGPTAPAFNPKIVVRGDNAGLGIPRGAYNLGHLNQQVVTKGAATIHTQRGVYAPTFNTGPGMRTGAGFGGGRVGASSGSRMSAPGPSHATSSSSHSSSSSHR
jgi:FecR protein